MPNNSDYMKSNAIYSAFYISSEHFLRHELLIYIAFRLDNQVHEIESQWSWCQDQTHNMSIFMFHYLQQFHLIKPIIQWNTAYLIQQNNSLICVTTLSEKHNFKDVGALSSRLGSSQVNILWIIKCLKHLDCV